MVDDGVPTNALEGHSMLHGGAGFATDVVQPLRSAIAFSACFGEHNGPTITPIILPEDAPERDVARMPATELGTVVNPLVVGVEVDPNHVEVFRVPAKLRRAQASEHIPRLELSFLGYLRGPLIARVAAVPNDVDGRVGVDDARSGRHFPDGFDGLDTRSHELTLQFIRLSTGERIQAAGLSTRPSKKRDFVDRYDNRPLLCLRIQDPEEGSGHVGETVGEGSREYVKVIGPPEMAEVPDDLHVCLACRTYHGHHTRKLVEALLPLYQVPPHPIPNRPHAVTTEAPIVRQRKRRVPRGLKHIKPLTAPGSMARALESAGKKALTESLGLCGCGT
jgi:hypothetical protein